ncbi:MAG: hypothetical protein GY811_10220 [Myxococcales bacterium]|nr:hypothetical protein [Myxococcales bacterium]
MHFDHDVDDVQSLKNCDLLVGADGITAHFSIGSGTKLAAYDCMTRSGRGDMDLLREQDREFVEAYDRARDAAGS